MKKRVVLKSAIAVILTFSLAIQARSQSILTVDLEEYHEQKIDHDLGEKGALFALSSYDVNSILSVSPEGKLNWNVSVKPDYRFEYFNCFVSSPNNKYVYAVYSTTRMSRHYTEFMQIDDLGNTKIYEYEQLHEEEDRLLRDVAGIPIESRQKKYGLDAYYSDNKYFYRIEAEQRKANLDEAIELEISRLQHEDLEFERKYLTVPAVSVPSSATGNLECDDFYVIGHDETNVYLARKPKINENSKMLFQVISISQNLELTSSKLIEVKLTSGNEIVQFTNNDSWKHHNNVTGLSTTAGTMKYDADNQLFHVYGATKQNTIFLITLDATGKLLTETEFKFSDEEKTVYDRISSRRITLSKNNRSLSVWTTFEHGTLDNMVVDDAGKVVKTGTHKHKSIAIFPLADDPLVLIQDMNPAVIKYYSELNSKFQYTTFFQYAVYSDVHYVASIVAKKKLNLMVVK